MPRMVFDTFLYTACVQVAAQLRAERAAAGAVVRTRLLSRREEMEAARAAAREHAAKFESQVSLAETADIIMYKLGLRRIGAWR